MMAVSWCLDKMDQEEIIEGDIIQGNAARYVVESKLVQRMSRGYSLTCGDSKFFLKSYPPYRWKHFNGERKAFEAHLPASGNSSIVYPVEILPRISGLIFPYIEGVSIGEVVSKKKLLSPENVWTVLQTVGGALQYIHNLGLVHLDVKPDNLLLEIPLGELKDDSIENYPLGGINTKLIDFGTLRETDFQIDPNFRLGNPATVSPEVLKALKVDHRADIYSLSATLYELLTGEIAFAHSNVSYMLSCVEHNPPPIIKPNVRVSRDLSDLISRGMQKDPKDRPQSVEEFVRMYGQAM